MVTEANIPSARRGIKLIDTVKAAGFDTLNEFQEFLAARGKPMIGTKGGEESLELLNSMVGQKDQYVKMYPDYVEMEERTLKTSNPKIKKQEGQKIANKLIEIADDANVLYGEKTTTKKTSFIKDAVKKYIPNLVINKITITPQIEAEDTEGTLVTTNDDRVYRVAGEGTEEHTAKIKLDFTIKNDVFETLVSEFNK